MNPHPYPYPQLRKLGRSLFHEDFDLEADTAIGLVVRFGGAVDPERGAALRSEIASILDSGLGEEAAAKVWFEQSDACYDPRADGITVREWLRQVGQAVTGEE